jgi:hyperosmotically inducible periplasmic protein
MKNHLTFVALLGLATTALTLAPGCASTPTRSSTGEYIDDSVVTTKVKTALARDAATPGSAISVETFKGVVDLSGFVDTAAQKTQAGIVTTKIEGVKEVVNNIALKTSRASTGEYIDDSVITTKVKSALLRTDGTPGAAISVVTFRGVVQLSGFVDTAAEKSQAAVVAGRIEGVTDVENSIIVK